MLTYMKLHNVIVLLKFGFCECLLWLSIAIGREGGVAPLISLAHSDFEVSMVLLFLDSFLHNTLSIISWSQQGN